VRIVIGDSGQHAAAIVAVFEESTVGIVAAYE